MSQGRLALVLALVALASGEECPTRRVVAQVATAIQADGTIEREVRLAGLSSDAAERLDAAWWRDSAGFDLADRTRWARVEEGRGWIHARGRFGDVAQVPAPVGHPPGDTTDRNAIQLERRDLLLATHFAYREEYGDPFDESARSDALDQATDRVTALVDAALRHRFGAGIDLSAVDAFLQRELRTLAAEARRLGEIDLPASAFTALGLAPPPKEAPVDAHGQAITEPETWWLCERLAERLTERGTPAGPNDVLRAFDAHLVVREPAAAGDELQEALDLLGVYLWGVYGAPNRPSASRFEWRLALPGRLLRTNGVPDGDSAAAWSFPDDRLAAEDRLMTAESLLLRRESLRALGARTRFDAVELDRLTELLTQAAADPRNRSFLQRAVDAGELEALREVPKDWPGFPVLLFVELADLLDPGTPSLPGP